MRASCMDTDKQLALGSLVRTALSTGYIVIFQLPQKDINSNDTRDIEIARDESNFNSKMQNFNMDFTSY